MRNRLLLVACLIAAICAGIFWWQRRDVPQTAATKAVERSATAAERSPGQESTLPPDTSTNTAAPELPTQAPATDTPPARTDANKPFCVDEAGKLVLDEQTRLNIEALFAQTDRADLPEARQNITAKLPPQAATEAAALLEQYENYSKAQRQSYPPGIAPATEEAALAELEGLHALRVAHFGPEVAKALYGSEEALTRQLIDLMRLEKDQSLSLQEKAERAQKLHDEIEARQQSRP